MIRHVKQCLRWLLVAVGFAGIPAVSQADEYPNSLVTIVVPFPAGGVYDLYGRMAAEYLTEALGQQFIVKNISGGQGMLGSQTVATAKPDGYTLLIGGQATHATNPHLFENMRFDVLNDFDPISLIALLGNVLVVNPELPVKNVHDYVAYAKANPGKVSFSHAGAGTSMSIAGELFNKMTGTSLMSVPYRGSALAANAVVTGEVQSMFANTISVVSHVKAGTLRPLGVTTKERQELIPEIAPIAEQGVDGYEMRSWFGLFAPAGTPKEIVEEINAEILKMVRLPEYEQRIRESGAVAGEFAPDEFADFLRTDYDVIGQVVKDAGLKAESE